MYPLDRGLRGQASDHAFDPDAWLMQEYLAYRQSIGDSLARKTQWTRTGQRDVIKLGKVIQAPLGDDFRQDHRHRKKRLDLFLVVMARSNVLDR